MSMAVLPSFSDGLKRNLREDKSQPVESALDREGDGTHAVVGLHDKVLRRAVRIGRQRWCRRMSSNSPG